MSVDDPSATAQPACVLWPSRKRYRAQHHASFTPALVASSRRDDVSVSLTMVLEAVMATIVVTLVATIAATIMVKPVRVETS